MLTTRTRSLLGATALAAGLLTTSAAFAYSDIADIKAMDFTTQNIYNQWINVVSNSKQKWDTIEPGDVSLGAHVMIDTRHYVYYHGLVDHVGIILGICENSSCSGKPLLWMRHPKTTDYENQMAVTFPTSKIPVSSSGGFATVPYGDDILARCNAGPQGKEHTFDYQMQATFAADTSMVSGVAADGNNGGSGAAETPATWTKTADHTLSKPFMVKVRCKPFEPAVSTSTKDPNPDPHRVKPVVAKGIDLFLTTVIPPPSAQHGPSGTQCKPLKVTTRIETDKIGPVPVKLWRQVNGGPITSEQKQMTAEALAGKFGDDWNKVEHFTQTTTVQYKAEVIGGTFAPSTQWKSITIHCNGNFAPQTNSDPNTPPRGKPQAKLPPAVAMPPAPCSDKLMKVRGAQTCIMTAPLPDKGKQDAERRRKAALEAEKRRREEASKGARIQRQSSVAAFGTAPARPRGQFTMGIMYRR